MRYPAFLKKGDTIGLVAPSFGVSGFPYEDRFNYACKKFKELGFRIVESDHLYGIRKGKSASARIRAREFMKMYLDDDIDFIFSVAGGELMLEILPYIDFRKIRKAKPKFFMGLSDNTCLTFALNTPCDTASIYGPCFGGFGM
ncbi:MAG: LD-carboxypeptidase, partial [Erysipelotrichaceae bacterium]|nr:LD-carboxypeptidase [Erysipelotrichaceae bacterium]